MATSPASAPSSPSWLDDRVEELIRRIIIPTTASKNEADLFIEQCRRSGLNPLLKEAFCVSRRKNEGNRERPRWVTTCEFQPAEGGMLARAERFPDFRGIQASAVYAEDEIVVDQGKGEVVHRFNPAKRKGSLVGAWARVVRDAKLPVVVWLDFTGYVQQTPLWAKIPTTMIEKCARVSALRKAYPEAFGGLYVREEMPPEEFPAPVAPASGDSDFYIDAEASPRATPPVAMHIHLNGGEPAGDTSSRDASPPPAPSTEVDGPPLAKTGGAPVMVAFGNHKGRLASELSDGELAETIDLAHDKLMEQPKAKWARAMRENLASLEAEAELRCQPGAPRKPERPPERKARGAAGAERRDPGQEG